MKKKNVFWKGLVYGIIIFLIGMSVIQSTGKIILYKQQTKTQNIDELTENMLDELFKFSDSQENLNINPSMKKIIKQAVTSSDDGKILPGIYIFTPCDPIDIQGVGTVAKNESTAVVYLHEGIANLNNSFSGEYIEWEIAAIGTFGNM